MIHVSQSRRRNLFETNLSSITFNWTNQFYLKTNVQLFTHVKIIIGVFVTTKLISIFLHILDIARESKHGIDEEKEKQNWFSLWIGNGVYLKTSLDGTENETGKVKNKVIIIHSLWHPMATGWPKNECIATNKLARIQIALPPFGSKTLVLEIIKWTAGLFVYVCACLCCVSMNFPWKFVQFLECMTYISRTNIWCNRSAKTNYITTWNVSRLLAAQCRPFAVWPSISNQNTTIGNKKIKKKNIRPKHNVQFVSDERRGAHMTTARIVSQPFWLPLNIIYPLQYQIE